MGFYHHYLATALNIIAVYNGDKPLEFHLKKYYSLNKKHGSKDRKVISDICYSYFRAAQAFGKVLYEENIINSFFLTHQCEHPLLEQLNPGLNYRVGETVGEKLKYLGIEPQKLFPFFSLLPNDFKNNHYYFSFLNQPDVFLRIRPGKKAVVMQKLDENNIGFIQKDEDCIALKNTTNTAKVANLIYLSPFFSLFFISAILGEMIHSSSFIALLFIVIGLILQQYSDILYKNTV